MNTVNLTSKNTYRLKCNSQKDTIRRSCENDVFIRSGQKVFIISSSISWKYEVSALKRLF